MADTNKKVANSLVAVSSAAVLAVYAAGYVRTRAAADRFALQSADRRSVLPGHQDFGGLQPEPPPTSADAPVTEAHSRHSEPAVIAPAPAARPSALPERPAGAPSIQKVPSTSASTATHMPMAEAVPVPVESPPPVLVAEQKIPEPAVAEPAPPKSEYKDGTYLGWGHCRHGDIQAAVVIADGRVASATIAQCLTRYSCSVIEKLPPQVAQRRVTARRAAMAERSRAVCPTCWLEVPASGHCDRCDA